MKQNKSAKDMAFEKERAKYRKEIRELESELKQKKIENFKLREQNEELEVKCYELKEWVNRLLEYTEMSEEDMRKLIQKEKTEVELSEKFNTLFGSYCLFNGRYFG